jgi:hypothetical protein
MEPEPEAEGTTGPLDAPCIMVVGGEFENAVSVRELAVRLVAASAACEVYTLAQLLKWSSSLSFHQHQPPPRHGY